MLTWLHESTQRSFDVDDPSVYNKLQVLLRRISDICEESALFWFGLRLLLRSLLLGADYEHSYLITYLLTGPD